jgi:sigma-B regulation protein RsbU (phosphoserine phosphatase)
MIFQFFDLGLHNRFGMADKMNCLCRHLGQKLEAQLKSEHKIGILRNCTFLSGVEDSILIALADESEVRELEEGTSIMTKGEHGSSMFFIESGKVRVHDGDVVLTHLEGGEVFGEMAVLDSDVRSASVTSETKTRLISLERDNLWKVISQSPEALKTIIASVLQRERNIVRDITSRTTQLQAYEKELEIGRRIQADFLPEFVPDIENWEIASYFEAAREVAGDFYDVFQLKPSGHIALVIGDVCDKGVGAALFMTLFRSLIRASCQHSAINRKAEGDDAAPEHTREILQTSMDITNRYIATTHSKSSMFATVFFGMLDPVSGEMFYINGGHESPVIFKPDGSHEILECTGGVLGLFPFAQFSIAKTQLNHGDLFFSYSDGVNEAKNEDGDQFSDRRIIDASAIEWQDTAGFLENIINQVRAFRGEAAQSDDITMLAIRNLEA